MNRSSAGVERRVGVSGAGMNTGDGSSARPAYWVRLGPELTWPGLTWAGLVIAAPADATVTVHEGTDVTATGQVRQSTVTAQQRWPGVFIAPAPARGTLGLQVTRPGGQTLVPSTTVSYTGVADYQAWWTSAATHTRGNGLRATTTQGDVTTAAFHATGLSPDVTGSQVLLAAHDATRDIAVLALHAPSGGWALVAVEVTGSGTVAMRADAVTTAATLEPATLSLAWHLLEPGTTPGHPGPTIALLGPPSATTAEITTTAGKPVAIPLTHGYATLTMQDVTRVQYLDTQAHVIGQTTPQPFWPDDTTLTP